MKEDCWHYHLLADFFFSFHLQFFIQGKFQIFIYLIFKLPCLQKKNINEVLVYNILKRIYYNINISNE